MSEAEAHFLSLSKGFRCLSQSSDNHSSTVMSLSYNVSIFASLPFKWESTHIFTPAHKIHCGFRLLFVSFSFFPSLIGVAKHYLVLISTLTNEITQHQDRPYIKMNTSAVQTDQYRGT